MTKPLIDVEPHVFTRVVEAFGDLPNTFLTGEYVEEPPSFPAVSVEMKDCYPDPAMRDSSGIENGSRVLFEVNAYSNAKTGAKSEAKRLAAKVDSVLSGMGMRRTLLQPVANPADASVARYLARYEAGVTSDLQFYR